MIDTSKNNLKLVEGGDNSRIVNQAYEDEVGEHVYHQYVVLSDRRDEILKALQDNQIGCAIYYPVPLHQQNVFKEECADLSLPVTEHVSATCFSLPICPFLSDDDIHKIVDIIRDVLKV